MVLQLRRIHLVFWVIGGILVEVGEEDGLAVGGFDVFARAAVAVAAGADFVVEGAVDLVLLGTEDGGEIVGHGGGVVCVVLWRGSESSVRWRRLKACLRCVVAK